jgi:hypothetical protein
VDISKYMSGSMSTVPVSRCPCAPVSTSDEVEEEENVTVEEDDGTIFLQFVAARTDLENVLPVICTQGVSSRLLNKLDKDGKNPFPMDLAMLRQELSVSDTKD